MSARAYATLVMTEQYVAGALVLASSLRASGSSLSRVAMHASGLSTQALSQLRSCFDLLVSVDPIRSSSQANLQLLGRPDLAITYSKLHAWRLLSFEKVVFMDADTLVLQNIDNLFDYEELSAAPDCGWPDIFNSGLMVLNPSQDTYDRLVAFAQEQGSWDGADQGLLNDFFSDWNQAAGRRLPFIYNVTPTTVYTYAPAFERYKDSIKVVHFAGVDKPWTWSRFSNGSPVPKGNYSGTMLNLVTKWWVVYDQNASSWGGDTKTGSHTGSQHNTYQSHTSGQHQGAPYNRMGGNSASSSGSLGFSSTLMNELNSSRYQWPEHEFGQKKPKSLKLYETNVLNAPTSTDDPAEMAERMRAIRLRSGPQTPTVPLGVLGDNFTTSQGRSASPTPLTKTTAPVTKQATPASTQQVQSQAPIKEPVKEAEKKVSSTAQPALQAQPQLQSQKEPVQVQAQPQAQSQKEPVQAQTQAQVKPQVQAQPQQQPKLPTQAPAAQQQQSTYTTNVTAEIHANTSAKAAPKKDPSLTNISKVATAVAATPKEVVTAPPVQAEVKPTTEPSKPKSGGWFSRK